MVFYERLFLKFPVLILILLMRMAIAFAKLLFSNIEIINTSTLIIINNKIMYIF